MTNRQWLETLSDEEFAKWNFDISCGMCAYNTERGMCDNLRGIGALIDEVYCIDGITKWLSMEHKGE